MANVYDVAYLPSPSDSSDSGNTVFARSGAAAEKQNQLDALAKLKALKERSTPTETPLMGLVSAKPGVPAHQMQVGTQVDDPSVLPWERDRRAARIQQELVDKNAASDHSDELVKAQTAAQQILTQLDLGDIKRFNYAGKSQTGAPPSSFDAATQAIASQGVGPASSSTLMPMLQAARQRLGEGQAMRLGAAFSTIASAHVQNTGTEANFPGAIRDAGGLPPVNTLTPDAAGAAGLPIDAILKNRAASGQPVFVGRGDNVARLAGPNSPATSTTPSTTADIMGGPPPATTVPPMQASAPPAPPKDHAHHISDMVRAGISGIAKLTGLYPGSADAAPPDMSGRAPMPGASPETMVSATPSPAPQGVKLDAATFAKQYVAGHPGVAADEVRQAYQAYLAQG